MTMIDLIGKGEFFLDQCRSRDYGIILTEPPPIVLAEREVDVVSVAGSSGDLYIDRGRYKNVTVPYRCAIIPGRYHTLREVVTLAVSMLRPTAGYRRLANTFDPHHYSMARISSAISVESIVEQAGKFTINFDCKPQRFLKSGEMPVRLEGTYQTVELYNPTAFASQPLITVYNSLAVAAAGTLTINGITVRINTFDDQVTLDCELMDAYRQVADGAPENWNSKIYAPVFPELAPGVNTISWTGGIGAVEIIPRWWTL